jgi:hypothetical protein
MGFIKLGERFINLDNVTLIEPDPLGGGWRLSGAGSQVSLSQEDAEALGAFLGSSLVDYMPTNSIEAPQAIDITPRASR